MLLLETGMLGVFVALDLFLFYVFWEAMLIPMYLIIGVWGGPRRVYAAVKFILYTLAGSAPHAGGDPGPLLPARRGHRHLHLRLRRRAAARASTRGLARLPLFLAFALAFAIKVPMFPFHTWLPDAHVEAPTAGSVILAGVLLKMGTYGFLRFCLPLFPDASHAPGAPWIVRARRDRHPLRRAGVHRAARHQEARRLLVSVSHLGFVMLGLFTLTPQGLVGGIIQMVNHGLSHRRAVPLVGMIYERRHTRLIADFGGLWAVMPAFSRALPGRVRSPRSGCPGLNGFVGEFLILVGAFQVEPAGGGPRHHRHHLRRGLPALDVPARDLRRGDARGELAG